MKPSDRRSSVGDDGEREVVVVDGGEEEVQERGKEVRLPVPAYLRQI